ncbi:hypothetical protein F2P81_017392 [Scophthalmus maximus]|uniref:Uncharacterized protein n=1 Tax=Scophthalmus maximus TaxID=52904 RepID=A0A6A4SHM7_SCOMX|nr:hypothetical protein F2P81_017392 [Scophthalmus maximus]
MNVFRKLEREKKDSVITTQGLIVQLFKGCSIYQVGLSPLTTPGSNSYLKPVSFESDGERSSDSVGAQRVPTVPSDPGAAFMIYSIHCLLTVSVNQPSSVRSKIQTNDCTSRRQDDQPFDWTQGQAGDTSDWTQHRQMDEQTASRKLCFTEPFAFNVSLLVVVALNDLAARRVERCVIPSELDRKLSGSIFSF